MYIHSNGKKFFKVALHLHSKLSDGKLTPDQILDTYRNHGFDAVALTDHWHYGETYEKDGMLVLTGCEYHVGNKRNTMHIVGIGMKYDPMLSREITRQEIIDGIKKADGLAILAHPAWSLNSIEDVKELNSLDGIEIYNSVSEQGQSLRAYSDHLVDLSFRNGYHFGVYSTDDAHYYDEIDNCKGWVMIEAEALTQSDLINALRAQRFFATQGPHLFVRREGNRLIIDCSPCSLIAILSDCVHLKNHCIRGENLTHYEYDITEDDGWVRVEVRDLNGKRAWSNSF